MKNHDNPEEAYEWKCYVTTLLLSEPTLVLMCFHRWLVLAVAATARGLVAGSFPVPGDLGAHVLPAFVKVLPKWMVITEYCYEGVDLSKVATYVTPTVQGLTGEGLASEDNLKPNISHASLIKKQNKQK